MAQGMLQHRNARLTEVAAKLGATVAVSDEINGWDVAAAGKCVGYIRYEPRARVWLATTGTESTVGDMVGCLRFVVKNY